MIRNSRRQLALLLSLTLLLTLAACGGNGEADAPPAATQAVAATAPGAADSSTAIPSPSPMLTPFPAPGEDTSRAEGDPTIPTRTPTPDPAAPAPTASIAAPEAAALPAPICNSLTLDNPEGPYYTPDTPERASLLEAGLPGERFVVSGYVLGPDCAPIPGAWLDFWHADAAGQYDNSGYRLRGHQFTDANGRYTLETVFPGLYPGRTRHIHVKVMAPGGPILTTQLYFPDEPQNATDGLYQPELEMTVTQGSEGRTGVFDFVIATE